MNLNNTSSRFLIGPSSTEHEQDNCSFQLCCTVIYRTVPSSTRADTVVATTKKVSEQDTKTFPKCYRKQRSAYSRTELENANQDLSPSSTWPRTGYICVYIVILNVCCQLINVQKSYEHVKS